MMRFNVVEKANKGPGPRLGSKSRLLNLSSDSWLYSIKDSKEDIDVALGKITQVLQLADLCEEKLQDIGSPTTCTEWCEHFEAIKKAFS